MVINEVERQLFSWWSLMKDGEMKAAETEEEDAPVTKSLVLCVLFAAKM